MASANLFQAYLQPPKSVSDYMAEMDSADIRREQLKAAQSRNAIESMTLQDTLDQRRSAAEDRNALQRIAATWSANTSDDERIASLQNSGRAALMAKGDELRKQVLERKKTEAAAGKDNAETALKHLDAMKFLANGVFANPSQETAMNALNMWERLTGLKADDGRKEVMAMTDPEQIKRWAAGMALKADQLLPQVQTRNTGGTTDTLAIDPITGKPTVTGSVRNTVSPDAALSAATQRRGQDLTDQRARETNNMTREANATIYDADRGVLINKGTGVARPAMAADGKPLAAKTPESTKKELASIDAQLSVLDGAIRDVKASPSAFTFKRGVATMAGPLSESVAGRFDSPSERDARSYVFNVVSKVINERAGAAQSAQELARLRSFLPAETDNAEQITDKLESFKGYLADLGNGYQAGRYQPQQPKAMTQNKGVARVTSDAEYEALPSGSTFVGPDGKTRRKP